MKKIKNIKQRQYKTSKHNKKRKELKILINKKINEAKQRNNNIIYQLYQTIKHFFPDLFDRIRQIDDHRKKAEYELVELIIAGIASATLRKEHCRWTSEQLKRLPDGIRETRARHVLIEFKYTESVREDTFRQIGGYEFFYGSTRNLSPRDVQAFVISSRIPRESLLETFEYYPAEKSGLYYSNNPFLKNIALLSLNDLSDELHNAFIKCFASRKKNKKSAFKTLASHGLINFQQQIQWFIQGLWRYWFAEKGDVMKPNEITPETIMEMGKMWGDLILSSLPLEERLKGLKPEEVLSQYKTEEVLAQYKPEEVLAQYKPEEVLSQYKPEEVLAQYKPEERLKGLEPEEIEAYLRKIKKTH